MTAYLLAETLPVWHAVANRRFEGSRRGFQMFDS